MTVSILRDRAFQRSGDMPEPILALGIGAYLFIVAINLVEELRARNHPLRRSRR